MRGDLCCALNTAMKIDMKSKFCLSSAGSIFPYSRLAPEDDVTEEGVEEDDEGHQERHGDHPGKRQWQKTNERKRRDVARVKTMLPLSQRIDHKHCKVECIARLEEGYEQLEKVQTWNAAALKTRKSQRHTRHEKPRTTLTESIHNRNTLKGKY